MSQLHQRPDALFGVILDSSAAVYSFGARRFNSSPHFMTVRRAAVQLSSGTCTTVTFRRLVLIWLSQQATIHGDSLSRRTQHGARWLKQPDKQKAASSITAGVEADGIELRE